MMQVGKAKRPYHSPDRVERSNRTRLAILQGAEAVFRERGYAAATMPSVAQQAGVSVATVYLYFPSKPALVRGLAELVTGARDLDVAQVLHEVDSMLQLQLGAAILRKLHERSEVVADVLRAAAGTDREVLDEWRRWQERHLKAVRLVAQSLLQRKALRSDVDVEAATDMLYVLGGADTFRQLVHERGWSGLRYERWLVEVVQRLLLNADSSVITGSKGISLKGGYRGPDG
jgi:AcrR family transcriptional regulator